MRKTISKLTAGFTTVTMALALSACANADKPNEGDKKPAENSAASAEIDYAESSVKIACQGSPGKDLNTVTSMDNAHYIGIYGVLGQLAVVDDAGTLHLRAAKSIETTDGGKTWEIVLNDGIKYDDGTPVIAQDVLDSFKAIGSGGAFQMYYSPQTVDYELSKAVDDKTLQLVLKTPRADFKAGFIAMVSMFYKGGDIATTTGANAYSYVEQNEQGLKLKLNHDYYGQKGKVETVEVRYLNDAASRAKALAAGEIDLAVDLDPAGVKSLRKNSDIVIDEPQMDGGKLAAFIMNTKKAPFDDPEVRVAMKQAIDREQLVNVVLGEGGKVANDIISIGYADSNSELPQRKMDKEAAKKVFEAKGIKEIEIRTAELMAGMLESAEMLKAQLAEYGITVTIKTYEPAEFYSDPKITGEAQMMSSFWLNRPFVANGIMSHDASAAYNFSQYGSPELQAKFDAAKTTVDDDVRNKLLKEAQKILWENSGEIIWGVQGLLNAHRSYLKKPEYQQGSLPMLETLEFVKQPAK